MKVVLQNLTKTFPNRNKKLPDVTAVNDFTFEIPDGQLIGLLGPSGCGKSTTLNLICGLEKPTSGKIFFGEDDVTDLPPENRGVGLVFQNYALYPHMTVRQNIMFPLQNFKGKDKLPKEEMLRRVEEAARLVQIEQLLDRKPSEMSGGQQQRVAIARALVKMPRVLLLDEPLSNLDARLRLQTREEIRRIQRNTGITTIFVTHDQNLFVAKFLGTPPINVYKGQVRSGWLWLGEDKVLRVSGVEDQELWVGVRPEGYIPREDGPLHCALKAVEVMGRDTSVVISHAAAVSDPLRAIISSELAPGPEAREIRFALKPNKVYLFDLDEQRLPLTAE